LHLRTPAQKAFRTAPWNDFDPGPGQIDSKFIANQSNRIAFALNAEAAVYIRMPDARRHPGLIVLVELFAKPAFMCLVSLANGRQRLMFHSVAECAMRGAGLKLYDQR